MGQRVSEHEHSFEVLCTVATGTTALFPNPYFWVYGMKHSVTRGTGNTGSSGVHPPKFFHQWGLGTRYAEPCALTVVRSRSDMVQRHILLCANRSMVN